MNNKGISGEDFFEAGQMAIFWSILHFMISRYGNQPMGQPLVILTMVYLNERGMPPTMTQLCQATGLPKASVSRYVSLQIEAGFVKETVDPNDRRRRGLVQTAKGRAEWKSQVREMNRIFKEIVEQVKEFRGEDDPRPAEELLEKMEKRTRNASRAGGRAVRSDDHD